MRAALHATLSDEYAETERLASLLVLELKALTSTRPALLIADVVILKNDAVTRLAKLKATRTEELRNLGYPADDRGLEALAAKDQRVPQQWSRLKACSERVSVASALNAALALSRLRTDTLAYESSQNEAPRAGLYGPDGRFGDLGGC